MSISKNVGGISEFLTKMRTRNFYKKSNNGIRKALEKVPTIGTPIIRLARRVKKEMNSLESDEICAGDKLVILKE